MPDKDVNLHVKVDGTTQGKQKLDQLGQSAKGLGDKTAAGQKKAGNETERATQKMSGMGRLLGSLKGQVLSLAGAWLGMQGVQKLITTIIAKLERMQQLQKEIYDRSISLGQVGQALEFQTGTTGQQQSWSQKASQLQQSGGLPNIDTAQQMMVSADIAFSKQGGIKNPKVLSMLNELAPFAGSAQLGGEEVAKLFEFAGASGIEPNTEAYKEYFAKVQAGFTSSKATSFGQFMIGLQKGATGYLTQGGSLDEAISSYSASRSVMSNESLAATLIEQTTRLSEGGYERPRKAIEKSLGVKWDELSMDERSVALLRYTESIPASKRTQTLVDQGVPIEIATGLGKMVSTEAKQTFAATRQRVSSATPENIEQLNKSYLESDLGKQRALEGEIAEEQILVGPKFAKWSRRLQAAQAQHKILQTGGKDKLLVRDKVEPHAMAYSDMIEELEAIIEAIPQDSEDYKKAKHLRSRLLTSHSRLITPVYSRIFGANEKHLGAKYEEELEQLKPQINITYDNSINYLPPGDQFVEKESVTFDD